MERFDETSLPNREAFYNSHDYRHAKRVYKEFTTKHLGDYHDLYVQSHTLLLSDVFENLEKMY